MKTKIGALAAALLTALAPLAENAPAAGAKPNIVMIMLDDLDVQSYQALLAAGHLPNIDRYLVKRGVSFQNSFVTNAVCCPSRATMLTGQYTKNHGVLTVAGGINFWFAGREPEGEKKTIATWMQKAGYRTSHVGKYLNGYGYSTAPTYVPVGYDEWFGLLDPFTYKVYDYKANENGQVVSYGSAIGEYQTDVLAGKASGVISRHADLRSGKPLFMVLTPIAPHIEVNFLQGAIQSSQYGYLSHFRESIRPPYRYLKLADNLAFNGEMPELPTPAKASFNADGPDGFTDKPPFFADVPEMDDGAIAAVKSQWKNRLAAVKAVDDMVGAVALQLLASGMLQNTVFILTSDNGYFFGEHRLSSKLFAYDESIRVPLIISTPTTTQRTETKIALNIDLAPTIAQLGGAVPDRVIDGRSLVPVLESSSATWERKRFLVEHYEEDDDMYIWALDSYLPTSSNETMSWLGDLSPTDYRAVRTLGGGKNSLYVQWYGSRAFVATQPIFKEYYDNSVDPLQLRNDQARVADPTLQTELLNFMGCAGETCRTLEK